MNRTLTSIANIDGSKCLVLNKFFTYIKFYYKNIIFWILLFLIKILIFSIKIFFDVSRVELYNRS